LDMIEDIAKDDSDEGAQYIVSFLLFRIGSFGSNVILCYYLPLYIKFGFVAD
jgi:hypothetical protein